MNVEEQIILILNKIKQMYKYDNNIKFLLDLNPQINVILVNNKLLLQELIYDYNDETIIIQNNKIIYKTPKDKRVLIEYKDFDDLIFL